MDNYNHQMQLFNEYAPALPLNYKPVRPDYFDVSDIYLARGSLSTPERQTFVERIVNLYPDADVKEVLDTPHNRIKLPADDPISLHRIGKHTLVFGELKTAVRFSEESGNTCPNYWHFSPYGFCPYGCKYCYLAGTQGVKFSPTVKIYLNLPEMLNEIDVISRRLCKPTAFYLGKLQDAFALDPLTHYSTIMIPFFAHHPYARLTILTKSVNIERLINLKHDGHTILSWSVNPTEICSTFEENVPAIEKRLEAMRKAASSGYPVRAVMMPIIPVDGWREFYSNFTQYLIKTVPLQRLTLGGICSYAAARSLMETKIGLRNPISNNIQKLASKDGRNRYSSELRTQVYTHIIATARKISPDLQIALCLEENQILENCGLQNNKGFCNCVL